MRLDHSSQTSEKNPRRDSENEQIRRLLERQKEQILASCGAETQKHAFQADYDRRNIVDCFGLVMRGRHVELWIGLFFDVSAWVFCGFSLGWMVGCFVRFWR